MERLTLRNGRLLVRRDGRYGLVEASLDIAEGVITGVGPTRARDARTVDVHGALVVPAFHNLHLHLGEAPFAGLRAATLQEYLEQTERFHGRHSPAERERVWQDSAAWTLHETLRSGTASIVAPRADSATSLRHVRAVSLLPVMNSQKLRDFFEMADEDVRSWVAARLPLGGLFLHSAEYVSERWLELASKLRALHPEMWVSGHVGEGEASVRACEARWGADAIEVLSQHSLLGPRTLLVHGGGLSTRALRRLADTRTVLVLCPVSNARLDVEPPRLSALHEMGVDLCIATDGVGTGGTVDPLDHARMSGLLLGEHDPHVLLALVTSSPARFLGHGATAGTIAVGAPADLCFLAPDAVVEKPHTDPAEALVWGGAPRRVGLMVAGKMAWSRPPISGPRLPDVSEFANRLRALWDGPA